MLRLSDFLSFSLDTIKSKVGSINVTLPHPANFDLHKLVVMGRRPKAEKQTKDKDTAIKIPNTLIDTEQSITIKNAFQAMSKRWQGMVKKQLTDITEKKILEALEK